MPDCFVRLARTRFDATDLDLAPNLGVTVGCLRSWDRKGAPRYGQLALCALIAGIKTGGRRAFADAGPSEPKGASARAMSSGLRIAGGVATRVSCRVFGFRSAPSASVRA
jgi:hypothetical protein